MVLSSVPVSASGALLQRHLRRASLATAGVVASLGIAACGGSSNAPAGAAHLLSQTFTANVARIHSGDLALTVNADLKGLKSLGGEPVALQLSGPFSESAGAATAFDFDATITFEGQTIPVGVLSTGKALYLDFAGTYYALPASVDAALAKTVQSPSSTGGASSNLLSSLGINPLSWLTNPKIVGSATVGGVATQHLTAQVDVRQLLGDVAKLATHTSGLTGRDAARELSSTNLEQVASAITSARVDIYSGTNDHILREFQAAIAFTIPPADQASLDGLTGGSLSLDVTITNLNAAESITAPSSSEPFSDLTGGGSGLPSL
jgi:hypothetical protein